MIKHFLLLTIFMLGVAQSQEVPYPNEKLESLFAGMREIDESRGTHAFAATIKFAKDHRGDVEDLQYFYLSSIDDKGQRLQGCASIQKLPYWKVKLSSGGKDHFRYGSRHRLVSAVKNADGEDPFTVPSFDPISQTMKPINSLRGGVSTSKGWHYRRSGKHLEDFKDGKTFDLYYNEPGIGFVKDKVSTYRFDRTPSPHVVSWNLHCAMKNGLELDVATTRTEWKQVQDRYLPRSILGTTALPGDGPKYFGAIEIYWDFSVPDLDVDASDWVDKLAKSFSVDPFLENEDE